VDSTANAYGALNPELFKALADAHPDILLIPENESMRYFAYSAPLNSYQHHKITSTPLGSRLVYPKAFSVLMAAEADHPEDHAALLNAVRRGDFSMAGTTAKERKKSKSCTKKRASFRNATIDFAATTISDDDSDFLCRVGEELEHKI
jgi:hypothetical protein